MTSAAIMLLALAIDAALGWPDRFFAAIGHPVSWLGRLIDAAERRWNRGSPQARILRGAACVALTVAAAVLPALLVQALLPAGFAGVVLGAVLAWPLLAARSLHDHVAAVARPLHAGDLDAARRAVARIVGRDPDRLDTPAVARAAIESLAENASDGVVAPVFWGVLLGLPGLAGYKAVNTLDSMIGHRNERFAHFGRVAARLDDVVNWVPARLTALLFLAALPGRASDIAAALRRDAPRHRSPNAGWPEAAMAGALGVRLSGPRSYGERSAAEPWMNAEAPDPGAADIARALSVYRRAMMGFGLVLALLALA